MLQALGYNAEQEGRKDCSHGTYNLDRGETGNDQINKENVWYEYTYCKCNSRENTSQAMTP